MKVPKVPVDIKVECTVHPSEDHRKVMRAVKNVLDVSPSISNSKIVATSKRTEALSKVYEHARTRAILGVLRRVLEDNMIANSTSFYLNKQAAFAGIVSICEEEAESPLGPIKVTITSNHLESIIKWLVS